MSAPSNPFDHRAEELFREYFSRVAAGEHTDFEAICRANSAVEIDLRRLKESLEVINRLRPSGAAERPLSERLKQQFGTDPGPTASLDDEPRPASGPSSTLFDKLRGAGTRGARYRLLGEVARGGMGVILKIWDDELRRTLAMKVVLGRGDESKGDTPQVDPKTLGRFLEEAQVTGQLDHPGIVPVHELGLGADGRVYFTMRLVKGEDLRTIFEKVRTGEDDWNQVRALGVLLKVCEAMSYAHSKKVVHRDLKPANVMVGKFGEVYVMDWGLARVLGREDKHDLRIQPQPTTQSVVKTERRERRDETPDSPLVTMDGDIVGTPSFMSPEQAKGQLDKLGPHSDVYALGAMLYQLVTGDPPYVPAGARVSQYTILNAVLHGPPEPIVSVAQKTPPELVAICEKAMAREIPERYANPTEFASDLRSYLEGRVVRAYEAGTWAETRNWVRRNKSLAATLALAVVSLIAGVVTSTTFATSAREKELIATQRANDVLSLSASKDLAELVERAEKLWPAYPAQIPAYETWLSDAHALIEGGPGNVARGIKRRPSLAEHKAKLVELCQRATQQSATEIRAEQESHPRYQELTRKRADLTWISRRLGLEPWPSEAAVRAALATEKLPSDSNGLNSLAWPLIDPDAPTVGEEVRGLLLARLSLAAASEPERSLVRDSVAWALVRLGRIDEALNEESRALAEVTTDQKSEFQGYLEKMEKAVEPWRGDAALRDRRRERDALLADVADLDRTVSERRTWTFENPDDAWWRIQLLKLVRDLELLRDPTNGLMGDTVSESFGWGIQKRYEFAKTIQQRSIDGPDAKARWSDAIAKIAASPKYGGMKLTPQIGLLPIGMDPYSGLWEFWHLQSGCEPARGPDGRLVPDEKMGLTLVLIPGGSFWMGSQKTDEHARNYDPLATPHLSPVHEVTLDAYFLSKYEMTEGQWLRFMGKNPSEYGPSKNYNGHQHDLLHPVESVTWTQCVDVMTRMGLSLPSEAQWENGCRGGTDTVWWTGSDRESLRGKANLADQSAAIAGAAWAEINDWPDLEDGWVLHARVGSFPANPYGLHDVHGNVWEWCVDGWQDGYYERSPTLNPVGPVDAAFEHVYRGGSFSRSARSARSAIRFSGAPGNLDNDLGLRPAGRVAL